jgi:hypothetical protein
MHAFVNVFPCMTCRPGRPHTEETYQALKAQLNAEIPDLVPG